MALHQQVRKYRTLLRRPSGAGKYNRTDTCYRHQSDTLWKGYPPRHLQNNIVTIFYHDGDQTLAGIDSRLQELQAELLKLACSKADYEHVADEIYACVKKSKRYSWKAPHGINRRNEFPIWPHPCRNN
jgi:hypothetical protein